MKKITYSIIFMFCIHLGYSQSESDYANTLSKISEAYNTKDADKLFTMFSNDLQSSFSLDKVKDFITTNHSTKGTIGDSSFITDEDKCKTYLVEFDNASMLITICLTPDKQLNQLKMDEY